MKLYPTAIFEKSDLEALMYYIQNKKRVWSEWLKLKKSFKRPGKQGLIGIMEEKNRKIPYVYKISQYINYLPQHEYAVMSSLNKVALYCPNFTLGIGIIECDVNPHGCNGTINNPFTQLSTIKPITKEVLLMSLIEDADKLYNHVMKNPSDGALYSAIKQVLCGIYIAQEKAKFTHYDLHSNNVMMKKCDRDMSILYVLSDKVQFLIPTYGYYPVIIDFGFAYAEGMKNGWLWPSLGHTEVGFLSDRFDNVADPKLFLVTISDEMKKRKNGKCFRKLVKKMYKCLDIQWDSGWDNGPKSVSDYATDIMKGLSRESKLFYSQNPYALDIIQTLIKIPLQKRDYSNFKEHYTSFISQFVLIEKEVNSSMYLLYILKCMVDSIRNVYDEITGDNEEEKKRAIKYVSASTYEKASSAVAYCRMKDVNFEVMITSLLKVVECIEGIYYEGMKKEKKWKKKEYKNLKYKNVEEVCGYLDYKIPSEYTFNKNSSVLVINNIVEKSFILDLTEKEIEIMNNTEPCLRGMEMYRIYKS